jgi:hypothetical protein
MVGRDLATRAASGRALAAWAFTAGALAVALSAAVRVPAAAELVAQDPTKVEAAYLRNFARYVIWPEGAFVDPKAPWRIGVLGRDPFGDVLAQTLQGRTEQDRTFEIRRGQSVEALRGCHIVFVGFRDAGSRRAALAELKGKPVLTVGDADGFLEEGGIIQFAVRDTVEMSINLDQARVGALKIQTKMLEVSRAVVEHGVTRMRR